MALISRFSPANDSFLELEIRDTLDLATGCVVTSDGLGCFAGVTDAGCQHRVIVAGGRKPKDLPEFNWINIVLGILKTSLGGAFHAFDFAKYGTRYLRAFVYRFNPYLTHTINILLKTICCVI